MAEPYPRNGLTEFRVLLDDETVARLFAVADDAHAPPEIIIGSIVRAVLEDDFNAHAAERAGLQLH